MAKSELRQRLTVGHKKDTATAESTAESDPEHYGMDLKSSSQLAGGTNKFDQFFSFIPQRWRNWVVRFILSVVMISLFSSIIYMGPLAIVLLVLGIQVKCFHEIITIGYTVYRSHNLPWFRTLSWYFLFASNYFFYGESMIEYFGILLARSDLLWPLVKYHRFISFSLYTGGIVWFVLILVKRHYIKQFTLFGWTHVTLLLIVASSHLIIQNAFEGIIWFLISTSMVIINDIGAYIFGFFMGRTPLIKLSPKKTWEGFIGGAVVTVVFGFLLSTVLLRFDYFVCPLTYSEEHGGINYACERGPEFQLEEYSLPSLFVTLGSLFGRTTETIRLYPFQLHSISVALFASIIGPFGGFFASGFKRAFKIKDFGDTIPGHGGLMDRFDCQVLMAGFVHVYVSSFIKAPSAARVLQQAMLLKAEDQLKLMQALQQSLQSAV